MLIISDPKISSPHQSPRKLDLIIYLCSQILVTSVVHCFLKLEAYLTGKFSRLANTRGNVLWRIVLIQRTNTPCL